MMKTRAEKIVAIAGGGLLVFGFVMCCSGIQFPFFNSQASLGRHLTKDFGVALPGSAKVLESYWVGARDSEEVYKVQMVPRDLALFTDALQVSVASKRYREATEFNLSRFGPLYKTPPWWNSPAMADAMTLEISIPDTAAPTTGSDTATAYHYRFLYSPASGTVYVVWGGF